MQGRSGDGFRVVVVPSGQRSAASDTGESSAYASEAEGSLASRALQAQQRQPCTNCGMVLPTTAEECPGCLAAAGDNSSWGSTSPRSTRSKDSIFARFRRRTTKSNTYASEAQREVHFAMWDEVVPPRSKCSSMCPSEVSTSAAERPQEAAAPLAPTPTSPSFLARLRRSVQPPAAADTAAAEPGKGAQDDAKGNALYDELLEVVMRLALAVCAADPVVCASAVRQLVSMEAVALRTAAVKLLSELVSPTSQKPPDPEGGGGEACEASAGGGAGEEGRRMLDEVVSAFLASVGAHSRLSPGVEQELDDILIPTCDRLPPAEEMQNGSWNSDPPQAEAEAPEEPPSPPRPQVERRRRSRSRQVSGSICSRRASSCSIPEAAVVLLSEEHERLRERASSEDLDEEADEELQTEPGAEAEQEVMRRKSTNRRKSSSAETDVSITSFSAFNKEEKTFSYNKLADGERRQSLVSAGKRASLGTPVDRKSSLDSKHSGCSRRSSRSSVVVGGRQVLRPPSLDDCETHSTASSAIRSMLRNRADRSNDEQVGEVDWSMDGCPRVDSLKGRAQGQALAQKYQRRETRRAINTMPADLAPTQSNLAVPQASAVPRRPSRIGRCPQSLLSFILQDHEQQLAAEARDSAAAAAADPATAGATERASSRRQRVRRQPSSKSMATSVATDNTVMTAELLDMAMRDMETESINSRRTGPEFDTRSFLESNKSWTENRSTQSLGESFADSLAPPPGLASLHVLPGQVSRQASDVEREVLASKDAAEPAAAEPPAATLGQGAGEAGEAGGPAAGAQAAVSAKESKAAWRARRAQKREARAQEGKVTYGALIRVGYEQYLPLGPAPPGKAAGAADTGPAEITAAAAAAAPAAA